MLFSNMGFIGCFGFSVHKFPERLGGNNDTSADANRVNASVFDERPGGRYAYAKRLGGFVDGEAGAFDGFYRFVFCRYGDCCGCAGGNCEFCHSGTLYHPKTPQFPLIFGGHFFDFL